jgi:hypothetical protein
MTNKNVVTGLVIAAVVITAAKVVRSIAVYQEIKESDAQRARDTNRLIASINADRTRFATRFGNVQP